jgi:hypothetical protein
VSQSIFNWIDFLCFGKWRELWSRAPNISWTFK